MPLGVGRFFVGAHLGQAAEAAWPKCCFSFGFEVNMLSTLVLKCARI
ncbi:hypothetical protein IMSAGC007_00312 [Lachnospiraceae bacterium]|nr:hypothetical protein IMSAGC007_00312 [Lachnospiraceae bacterium]